LPFDGIVTKNIVSELSDILTGARIEKIYQPEPDEIIINLRTKGQNLKLYYPPMQAIQGFILPTLQRRIL